MARTATVTTATSRIPPITILRPNELLMVASAALVRWIRGTKKASHPIVEPQPAKLKTSPIFLIESLANVTRRASFRRIRRH
jgi:hypothetical protein